MARRPLSAEELQLLAKLEAMPDEDIDLSDIPEMTDEMWSRAVRPMVSIHPRVVTWFKEHTPGGDYHREINRVLREYVADANRRA
jgi:uncharacterized protein (DUF4415 family)